jgi:hypothetical protein
MRTLCSVAVVFLAVAILPAAEPKRNPLSPKEISEGWISLLDGESLFGWTPINDAKWHVFKGMLYPEAKVAGPLVSTSEFHEFELQMEFQVRENEQVELRVGCDYKGETQIPEGTTKLTSYGGWTVLTLQVRGGQAFPSFRSIGGFGGFAFATKAAAIGPETKPIERGFIALAGNGLTVRKMILKPLNAKPLFNGKDLTGWKEFKGDKYKSQFSVTKDGTINIKNGPGDLQTEGQWADFILQLECISNGTHLNSGVFFRAVPNEYQQGYEAQIRNEFKDEAVQEYTLDVHDPKSGELKEKVKAKYAAVDYGTGGIYRRQPARVGVAKDGDWFTMTIIANGRHIATWVDGVPVADWVDNRTIDTNARNGAKLNKGCISLQGHDPTTDLSFRNLRIVDLSATK